MRQIWISKAGPPEVLEVRETTDPEAKPGEVRIRVRAAGINFADLMARQGIYPDAPKIPCVIGYEVSGQIDQVGDETGAAASGLAVGDRVFALTFFGGYSDVVCVPAQSVFKMPEAMSFEEGAALPVVYLTAHHMMLFIHNLRPRSRVLIHSAAGGVGLAAIQIARSRQCEIFGTASTNKHEFLKQEGCAHPIDSGADVKAAVRAILDARNEKGLDLILDPVGGPSSAASYGLLDKTGHLVCFGASGMAGSTRNMFRVLGQLARMKWFNPLALMNDNRTVSGVNMAHLFDRLDLMRPQAEQLLAMYEKGEIKPHIDKTFRFEEAAAAHSYLSDRKAKGKLLLVP